MATATVERPLGGRAGPRTRRDRATRVVVAALGALVGLAGVEHGVGEIMQGPGRPDGLFIMSWPDAAAMEVLSGEPALTVIPNLFVTGVLSVMVGLAVAAWSIWFAAHRPGGLVLIGLSVVLLLVGGGVAPPVMGVVVGTVATRIGSLPRRAVSGAGRAVAGLWPWFLAAAVAGYLALVPGMPLASFFGLANAGLVVVLAVFAFVNFGLALWASRASDRLEAAGS